MTSQLATVALILTSLTFGAARAQEPPTPGPKDGPMNPATDLERVKIGDVAPDFTLSALDGRTVTLSNYRGQKHVVLVFYRGHW